MKVYIAGPMRGLSGWNLQAFHDAVVRWKAAGHQPFSPALIVDSLGYRTDIPCNPHDGGRGHLLHVIEIDLACIRAADALCLLPGWERSRGSTVELALAQFLGLPIYDAVTMQEIHPVKTPWTADL